MSVCLILALVVLVPLALLGVQFIAFVLGVGRRW
jgi:hypothetical protein